jgi:hypothetical protein
MMKSLLAVLLILAPSAYAQTSQQMEYERQQREYRLQMERQQQEQQRQQQIMQENARRQQEEMNRLNRPAPGNPVYSPPGSTPTPNYGSQNQRPQSSSSGGGNASSAQPTGPAPAIPAPPQSWVKLGSFKTADLYADPATIRRTGNRRQMALIRNYKEYQQWGDKSFLSSKEILNHDCDNQRSKWADSTHYSQHNARGVVVGVRSSSSDTLLEPTDMGGLIGEQLKLACK